MTVTVTFEALDWQNNVCQDVFNINYQLHFESNNKFYEDLILMELDNNYSKLPKVFNSSTDFRIFKDHITKKCNNIPFNYLTVIGDIGGGWQIQFQKAFSGRDTITWISPSGTKIPTTW